jgi:hypothetical protein
MATFDIPHHSFGEIDEKLTLKVAVNVTTTDVVELTLLQMVCILFSQAADFAEYTPYLISYVVSSDIFLSVAAALVYEALFLTFPVSSGLFLSEIVQFSRNNFSLSPGRLHRLLVLFSHCLALCQPSVKNPIEGIVSAADFLGFCALCSPYPESRILAHDILERASLFKDDSQTLTLFTLLRGKTTEIEQAVISTVLTEYSTSYGSISPVHTLPSIALWPAAFSPFNLLWKFFLVQIFRTLLTSPLVEFLIDCRAHILEAFAATAPLAFDHEIGLNKLAFLFSTSSGHLPVGDATHRKNWVQQISAVDGVMHSSIASGLSSPQFSFVCASVHLASLSKVIASFLQPIEEKATYASDARALLSSILRHWAVHSEFSDYVSQMSNAGQIRKIFTVFDKLLPGVSIAEASPMVNTVSNYLVFKARYFQHLHLTRLETRHGPIPRCARPVGISDDEISPVLQKSTLFELLFGWCLHDCPIGHVSRVTLNHLAALGSFFRSERSFTPKFFEDCSVISQRKPAFLRHLLSNHFYLLMGKFLEYGLNSPLEIAEQYLVAISGQFLPPAEKDSLIYSIDTLLVRVDTSSSSSPFSDNDRRFVNYIYSETGTLLLLGMIFLLHDEVHIRQSAMRMIAQVAPVLSIMRSDGQRAILRPLLKAFRSFVISISTQNREHRMTNAIAISEQCAKVFVYATEQIFSRAFVALPKIWHTRKCCTRDQMIRLLIPWTNNIVFDLKNRLVLRQNSTFYSPYSFVSDLCHCMVDTEWSDAFLSFWKSLADTSEMSFLVLAIVDLAIENRNLESFAIRLLAYLYRLSSNTVNFLLPLISYGNWYFYHVQLGKFEEIGDMTEYLLSCGQTRATVKVGKSVDQYYESSEFALKAIKALVKEDIMPLSNEDAFSVIVSFCLTQMRRKSAFELLTVYSEVLKTCFDSGFPRSLRNICEILDRTASIPFETLQFTAVLTESPLRALQHRTVSLPGLLDEFVNLIGYLPTGQEDIFALQFLLLGLSCGDLRVAAVALNLYAAAFKRPDPRAIPHLIESVCLVTRCWITSERSDQSTHRIGDYLRGALRVCRVFIASNGPIPAFFRLVGAILGVGSDLLAFVVDEALQLLCDLIDLKCWDAESGLDFREIMISAVLVCRDPRLLFHSLICLFDLPSAMLARNGDFALYLIIFAPLLCFALDSPQALATICDFAGFRRAVGNINQHFKSSHIAALLSHYEGQSSQTFAFDLIHTLRPLTNTQTIETAATLFSALVKLPFDCSISGIFDLGCALLSVSSAKEVIDGLAQLTYEATLNERTVLCASKIRFLQAISNCSDHSQIPTPPRPRTQFAPELDQEFKRIQLSVNRASSYPSAERVYKVRFDSIESFPPIFPFEEEFLQCEIVREVTNFCRRIQVNPQSNWAFSLYCATDVSECKGRAEADSPAFNLDLDFSAIIARTLEEIMAEEAEGEEEGESSAEKGSAIVARALDTVVYSFGEGENRTHSVHMSAFLPELAEVDEVFGIRGFPVAVLEK